ncbi:unnamed protein product [Linum trigynum]|uniref:Uncharacterized protein n=1 Tax=Linum trigynum TaxID=586398 RepID=A0AAV2G2C5_9ROSI
MAGNPQPAAVLPKHLAAIEGRQKSKHQIMRRRCRVQSIRKRVSERERAIKSVAHQTKGKEWETVRNDDGGVSRGYGPQPEADASPDTKAGSKRESIKWANDHATAAGWQLSPENAKERERRPSPGHRPMGA